MSINLSDIAILNIKGTDYHCIISLISKNEATKLMQLTHFFFFFFNWYSLHARLNSHYEAWSYKKRKHKKVKAYRKPI